MFVQFSLWKYIYPSILNDISDHLIQVSEYVIIVMILFI